MGLGLDSHWFYIASLDIKYYWRFRQVHTLHNGELFMLRVEIVVLFCFSFKWDPAEPGEVVEHYGAATKPSNTFKLLATTEII